MYVQVSSQKQLQLPVFMRYSDGKKCMTQMNNVSNVWWCCDPTCGCYYLLKSYFPDKHASPETKLSTEDQFSEIISSTRMVHSDQHLILTSTGMPTPSFKFAFGPLETFFIYFQNEIPVIPEAILKFVPHITMDLSR